MLEPALQFIAAMAPRLETISKNFLALPQRTGGSLMRIHRDVRFSGDKRPYKTNVGIQFRHVMGKDVHAPGFYFHLEPGVVFVGAGLWRPEPEPLAQIRDAIVAQPDRWRKICSDRGFADDWELGGDSLKRPPRGYARRPSVDRGSQAPRLHRGQEPHRARDLPARPSRPPDRVVRGDQPLHAVSLRRGRGSVLQR